MTSRRGQLVPLEGWKWAKDEREMDKRRTSSKSVGNKKRESERSMNLLTGLGWVGGRNLLEAPLHMERAPSK